jgi:hypothetical protein
MINSPCLYLLLWLLLRRLLAPRRISVRPPHQRQGIASYDNDTIVLGEIPVCKVCVGNNAVVR